MLKTHHCADLNEQLLDASVTLCGWLHRRRDHGGLTFFDLRDRSGLAQVVFNEKTNAALHGQVKAYGPEYVLRITGTVRRRPKGTVNPKLASGAVELAAASVEVLNPSATPPIEIDDTVEVSDDIRMQWRYLDLRRPSAQQRLTDVDSSRWRRRS